MKFTSLAANFIMITDQEQNNNNNKIDEIDTQAFFGQLNCLSLNIGIEYMHIIIIYNLMLKTDYHYIFGEMMLVVRVPPFER